MTNTTGVLPRNERDRRRAERLLGEAYVAFSHMEYNLAGHLHTEPLVKFREGLKLLKLNINPYLPSEHGEIS